MPLDCDRRCGEDRSSIKSRNVFGQMLNSSPKHDTANMKLLVLTVVCFAAALAIPADRQKRDILPGDPRLGKNGNHHHHDHHDHHQSQNEVLSQNYGPPNYKPGKPLNNGYLTPLENADTQLPSTNYGIPDTSKIITNNFIDDNSNTFSNGKTFTLNTNYQTPPIQPPSGLYETGYVHKSEEHIHNPKNSYGIPIAQEQPRQQTTQYQNTAIPEAVQTINGKSTTQKHIQSTQTEDIIQHTIRLPITRFTAEILPSTSYDYSYPTYQLSGPIPVRTIDHHIQVPVPQPIPIPVTKHIRVPVPVPQPIEVPKPIYIRVPQPIHVTVDQHYPVEVSRPVPVVTQYVTASKASPLENFFDNTATAFQDIIANIPNLDNFQNLPNFQFPSLPSPSLPQLSVTKEYRPTIQTNNEGYSKKPVTGKYNHQPVITKLDTTAETTVTQEETVSKQQYIQPTGINGGYVY